MNAAISGAILLGLWAIGLFFYRFKRQRGDRLFGFFACAFWLMAVERAVLIGLDPEHEFRPYVYTIRLVAFLFIIYAIYDKNRSSTHAAEPTRVEQKF